MGLERTAAFLQGVSSIFEIDTMRPIVDYIAERAGTRYGADPEKDVSLRVITDHMRGVTFLVYDGVLPGNEGRGYVLRRLLRRAARHARLLEIDGPFLASVAERVAQQMASEYPEVQAELPRIQKVIARERAGSIRRWIRRRAFDRPHRKAAKRRARASCRVKTHSDSTIRTAFRLS